MTDYKKTKSKKISLGFTEQEFEQGVHICQLYGEEEERHNALVDFIVSGIKNEENIACFTEKETNATLTTEFNDKGFSFDEVANSGQLTLSETEAVYFKNNKFDPDIMLGLLKDFYKGSLKKNYKGARVIGEMSNYIETVEGGSRLLEYESKVSILQRKFPVSTVCQYDAREFSGESIMNILKVHPYMIIKGSVISNPFYVKPEVYLQSIAD